MAMGSALQIVNERSWRGGLWNLTRKEIRDWFGTRSWLIQSLVWLVILNGITLSIILLSSDPKQAAGADPETARLLADKTTIPLDKFFEIAGIVLALGVVVLAQDEVIGEKRSGTAAWILSKPVSRAAFVLSKVLGNIPGVVLVMVLLPGAVTYLMVSLSRGSPLPVANYLGGLAALFLSTLVFLALTVMLSTLTDRRGVVLGIPLVLILGFMLYMMFLSDIYEYFPQSLTTAGGDTSSVALALAMGQPLPSLIPIAANAVWFVLFVAVAAWRFSREEL